MSSELQFYREENLKTVEADGLRLEIPEEWEVVRLGDVAEIRKNKVRNDFTEVAFIPMELVPDSKIFAKYEVRNISDISSSTYCEANDLLLAKITPSFENGKQGIVPKDIPNGFAFATTEVYPLVCKDISNLFLFYLLKFQKFRRLLEFSIRGTTGRRRVPKKAVEDFKIPLPPLPEQQKITHVLMSIDKAIEAVDEAIKQAERIKKGLMQELLTKGIGHKEFKDTEIGRIPKEWGVARLEEVCSERKETVDPSKFRYMPYVGLEHIDPSETKLSRWGKAIDVKSAKHRFYAGDILYGKLRPYLDKAVLAEFSGIASTDIIVLKPTQIDLRLLVYLLHTEDFVKYATTTMSGTNHPRTSWKDISKFKIPLPPLQEQQKIAEILSKWDEVIELKKNKKERLERMKKRVMDLLLTGKVRIR